MLGYHANNDLYRVSCTISMGVNRPKPPNLCKETREIQNWVSNASDNAVYAAALDIHRNTNFTIGFLYAINGILFLLFGNPGVTHIFFLFLSQEDEVGARDHLDIPVVTSLTILLLIKTALHFAYASVLFPSITGMLRDQYNDYRWFDYALSYGVVAVYLGGAAGIFDGTALIIIMPVTWITILLLRYIERGKTLALFLPVILSYGMLVFIMTIQLCLASVLSWYVYFYVPFILMLASGHGIIVHAVITHKLQSFVYADMYHHILCMCVFGCTLWLPRTLHTHT